LGVRGPGRLCAIGKTQRWSRSGQPLTVRRPWFDLDHAAVLPSPSPSPTRGPRPSTSLALPTAATDRRMSPAPGGAWRNSKWEPVGSGTWRQRSGREVSAAILKFTVTVREGAGGGPWRRRPSRRLTIGCGRRSRGSRSGFGPEERGRRGVRAPLLHGPGGGGAFGSGHRRRAHRATATPAPASRSMVAIQGETSTP